MFIWTLKKVFKSNCVEVCVLCMFYVSDCNNDNNGNNKIQEIEKYRTGLKSFKPKNEICCWLQYTTCKVLWIVKITVLKILFALW